MLLLERLAISIPLHLSNYLGMVHVAVTSPA